MVQVNNESPRMKVIQELFSKDSSREFLNPLASPTTPLHFEQGSRHFPGSHHHHHLQQQGFENPWLQNSIQLQLLNYVRTFHGVQQPIEFQQQAPHYSPPPQPMCSSQQHPTITLLQQRFQRLERDREMRHAKQLYSTRDANPPSTSASCACNLELSLPPIDIASPDSSRAPIFIEERKRPDGRSSPTKSKLLLSLLPNENEHERFKGLSFSSPSPETQLLLREWETKESSGGGNSSAMAAVAGDDEVDTSLHL